MSKRVIVATVEGDVLHTAAFQVSKQGATLIEEERLGPHESSRFAGKAAWLVVTTADRSIRYFTLPKSSSRNVRRMAEVQAGQHLALLPQDYLFETLVRPLGSQMGALVVAVPRERAAALERRAQEAGLRLAGLAVEPLTFTAFAAPNGNALVRVAHDSDRPAVVGCRDGLPVLWRTGRRAAHVQQDHLVAEYFVEEPEELTPDEVVDVPDGGLARHEAAARYCAQPGALLLTESLRVEEHAPAGWAARALGLAAWAVALGLALATGYAMVRQKESQLASLRETGAQVRSFARRSAETAAETSEVTAALIALRERSIEKVMAVDVLRSLAYALPSSIKMTSLSFDAAGPLSLDCTGERMADILLFIDQLRNARRILDPQLMYTEANDEGQLVFRIECKVAPNREEAEGGAP